MRNRVCNSAKKDEKEKLGLKIIFFSTFSGRESSSWVWLFVSLPRKKKKITNAKNGKCFFIIRKFFAGNPARFVKEFVLTKHHYDINYKFCKFSLFVASCGYFGMLGLINILHN
jgi:hypothetical protein